MSSITQYNRIYFIGIGGIGMSALARYFKAGGYDVAGYDITSSVLTDALQQEGIPVSFEDAPEAVPEDFSDPNRKEDTLIVYTPAIPENNKELDYFKGQGYTILKRARVLGLITEHLRPVAVAGTHGKTTISTLIAHILKQSILDCSAFLGGISKNYDTNLLIGESSWVVVEADEYDRSFLYLHPEIAVVSAMDADHLDIYKTKENLVNTFHEFLSQVQPGGKILVRAGLPVDRSINTKVDWFTYSLDRPADYTASGMSLQNGYHIFHAHTPEKEIRDIHLGLPGRVNVENALAAIAVAHLLGVSDENMRKALLLFQGVRRRFDIRVNKPGHVYIDDYAHHPVELKAAIESVREMFPGKKLTGIFQPHLYSRTRDFAAGFAGSLDLLDSLILTDIYPAREKPIQGVTSNLILDKMKLKNKIFVKKEMIPALIRKQPPEVLLTLGAGDIDRLVEPLEAIYRETD